MIEKPTVFVLGAGASFPFGFPIGRALSEHITTLEPGNHYFESLITDGGFSSGEITVLRDAFSRSGVNSIDAFLEHRTDLMEIGKAAIARILIDFEDEARLFAFSESNWMRYLYEQMHTSFDRFSENRVSFITFNYDRSLEHFLFLALQNSHKKSDEKVAEVLSKIQIIHLHGRLDYLPWQNTSGRAYNRTVDMRTIRACMAKIKIVHEDISDGRDRDFETAKHLLNAAEQIRFLGFGYNSTNISRLGEVIKQDRDIRGTGYGVTTHEAAALRRLCSINVHPEMDCIGLLRNYVTWK